VSTATRSEATPADPQEFVAAVRQSITTGTALRLQEGENVCEVRGDLALAIVNLIDAITSGEVVQIHQFPEEISTGQAADLLGVSRPTVVSLVDRQLIPATRIGTHRRIKTGDVLAYREASRRKTRRSLEEVIEVSRELGLYDE
jgi:excisionase family DNA binding protein